MSDGLPSLLAPEAETRVLTRLADGRVVWMPKAWRRCPTGVTNDPPPSLRERRDAPPALTALERAIVAAIKAESDAKWQRGGFCGRTALHELTLGHKEPSAENRAALAQVAESLAARGIITIEHMADGSTRYRLAGKGNTR